MDNGRAAEEEATAFALLLLMPRESFVEAMRGPLDLFDEPGLAKVARQFQVNVPMVLARQRLEDQLRKRRPSS